MNRTKLTDLEVTMTPTQAQQTLGGSGIIGSDNGVPRVGFDVPLAGFDVPLAGRNGPSTGFDVPLIF